MNPPDEQQWRRVEKLARESSALPKEEVSALISKLAEDGEAPTVLTMLGNWLGMPPPPVDLAPGTIVGGRYTLKEKIGSGGMASVWRAKQEVVERDVALKMIHPALVTPHLKERFVTEIKLLGQLVDRSIRHDRRCLGADGGTAIATSR